MTRDFPRLGLGTAPLGNLYEPITPERASATIEAALAAGVSLFDTAPLYGAGESERRLGQILRQVPRDSFVLSTKVGRLVQADGSVVFNFSRDGVLRSISDSLERLGLDRIDVVHVHDPDDHRQEALDSAFPTLIELREQGLIRAVGAGMNQWQMLADFARRVDLDCMLLAGRYTLLEQTSLELLDLCRQRGIGLFLGGIFNSGILATGARPGTHYNYAPPPADVIERVQAIEAICARHGAPLPVAALQFVAAHPAVTSMIFGAVDPAEVTAAVNAFAQPLPAELWADLRAAGMIAPAAPTP